VYPFPVTSPLQLRSSDPRLNDGFQWAKAQALEYVFNDDPVGPWYEAALPGRAAFCMRDVSHQAAGAQTLGLAKHNANMLRRFAEAIDECRDWCSFWEIDKSGAPCPVDYDDDQDFWYNLPANFDVIDACYRMFLWTGDHAYADDPVFLNFYEKSLNEYVKRWDRDGDGLVEGRKEDGRRGIGSYNETFELELAVTTDLLLRQYAAGRAYASILKYRGEYRQAEAMHAKADALATLYRTRWWDPSRGRHYAGMHHDGTPYSGERCLTEFLLCDEIPSPQALKELTEPNFDNVEELSYLAEVFYKHDLAEDAYHALMRVTEPSLPRREYPEVSYGVVGAIAEGLMGIAPDARTLAVETLARLPQGLEWVELENVPVFGNTISVRHEINQTTLTNLTGPEITWRPAFLGNVDLLHLNGTPAAGKTLKRTTTGANVCSWVETTVQPGQTVAMSLPG
jgi:tetratricopeptide (TPR) repeat protein